ncbi:MAG: hypothetical protein KUG79_09085 [Pseudomonadales bacterium]|nr:hypothetical protein [Pseudomonadales bacterium]
MRDSFIRALTARAKEDSDIVLITGDLGFSVLDEFAETFPDQFVNAGVAEQNMTMLACGMALDGAKVFTYSIANFTILRCLEQLRNDVCYHNADVTAVSVGGGFSYGQLGMSHFATEDLAIMRALPNMKVIAPSSPVQATRLTNLIIDEAGPCYLRLDKGSSNLDQEKDLTIGKSIKVRDGSDVTLVSTGAILRESVIAAELLSAKGIEADIIDMHTLKPLDETSIITSANKTKAVVSIEEHNVLGGLGSAVAEILAEEGVAKLKRVGLNDLYPTIVGDQNFLRKTYNMDANTIYQTALVLVNKSR